MVARTHNVMAFACLLTAAVYSPPNDLTMATLLVCLVANTAGSMLPDIDQASNKLWDMLPFGDTVGRFLNRLFPPHRTLSHSLLGLFVTFKITDWLFPIIFNGLYINSSYVAVSLMIGYISHLIADGLTEEGLPLFFPLKNKFGFPPKKSWRIKTDHWFEKYVVAPGIVVYTIVFAIYHWSELFLLLR